MQELFDTGDKDQAETTAPSTPGAKKMPVWIFIIPAILVLAILAFFLLRPGPPPPVAPADSVPAQPRAEQETAVAPPAVPEPSPEPPLSPETTPIQEPAPVAEDTPQAPPVEEAVQPAATPVEKVDIDVEGELWELLDSNEPARSE